MVKFLRTFVSSSSYLAQQYCDVSLRICRGHLRESHGPGPRGPQQPGAGQGERLAALQELHVHALLPGVLVSGPTFR